MSFWRTYYHIVWTTKHREPMITPELESRLFPHIVSIAAELGVYVYAINGWSDRLHVVVAIPPKKTVSEVVKMMKGASSHYVNERHLVEELFTWQEGYGVYSLGEKQRAAPSTTCSSKKSTIAAKTPMPGWNPSSAPTRARPIGGWATWPGSAVCGRNRRGTNLMMMCHSKALLGAKIWATK